MKCLNYGAAHYAVFSSFMLRSIYSPQTLFSYALRLHSSLSVRHQVSHPYITRSKFMGLYILISEFLKRRQEDRFWTEWWQAFPRLSAVIFVVNANLICYCCSQILQLCRIFRGVISNQSVMILTFILVVRHNHILSSFSVYF